MSRMLDRCGQSALKLVEVCVKTNGVARSRSIGFTSLLVKRIELKQVYSGGIRDLLGENDRPSCPRQRRRESAAYDMQLHCPSFIF